MLLLVSLRVVVVVVVVPNSSSISIIIVSSSSRSSSIIIIINVISSSRNSSSSSSSSSSSGISIMNVVVSIISISGYHSAEQPTSSSPERNGRAWPEVCGAVLRNRCKRRRPGAIRKPPRPTKPRKRDRSVFKRGEGTVDGDVLALN